MIKVLQHSASYFKIEYLLMSGDCAAERMPNSPINLILFSDIYTKNS